MAKKKSEEELEESEQLSVIGEQTTSPDLTPDPSPNAPFDYERGTSLSAQGEFGEGSNREYEEKSWMGKALFVCSTCTFDTFDEEAMLEHLIGAHNSESALKQFYTSATRVADVKE